MDLEKYPVDNSWLQGVRILSLFFTTWHADHRSRAEQLRDPMLLDVGWVELTTPELAVKAESTVHLVPVEKGMLRNPNNAVSPETRLLVGSSQFYIGIQIWNYRTSANVYP